MTYIEQNKQKQVMKFILLKIFSNTWKKDEKFKSRAWFVIHFDTSLSTMKKVFKQLSIIKIIYLKNGRYYVGDLEKYGLLQNALKHDKNKNYKFVIKFVKQMNFAKICASNPWIDKGFDIRSQKYKVYNKFIYANDKQIRKTLIFCPFFLQNNLEELKGHYLAFLAFNGYVITNKIEISDCVGIKNIKYIRLREIMFGNNKQVLKIAIHWISLDFFKNYTNNKMFV